MEQEKTGFEEMLAVQALNQGVTEEELKQAIMSRMFTPQERKILSMSEEQVRIEFDLIKDKKSDLSSRERSLVEGMAIKLNIDGEV